MRVTDKMIFERAAALSGRAREEAEAAAIAASTGVRVRHPGDDPTAAGLLVTHRTASQRLAAIEQVADRAADELSAADGALGGVNDVLIRARELAIQFANGTYSAADRAAGANELRGLSGELLALANTQFGNRYLFAGHRDRTPPFDAAGTFTGDAGIRQLEIAPGVVEDASVRGDVFFKGAGGGVDLFTTLSALETALAANDITGVQNTLDAFDAAMTQISGGRSRVGHAANLFATAVQTARVARETEDVAAGHLADADMITSASRLALAQRALDAALTASARSFDLTLLSKLR